MKPFSHVQFVQPSTLLPPLSPTFHFHLITMVLSTLVEELSIHLAVLCRVDPLKELAIIIY